MIVDLHSHDPMHVLAGEPSSIQWMLNLHRRSLRDIIRTLILRFANWVGNYPEPGMEPAVTIERLEASNVRVALSVLYAPFAEMDLSERYGAPPRAEYFDLCLDCDLSKFPDTVTPDSSCYARCT